MVKEAAIAAGLTGLMILLFLGSWRSTLIVVISIPLSILVSIIVLGLLGETLNVMTLGGMALAVGILVDDATVEIENIHRNLHQGKHLVAAILDGAQQIAVPAFVSTLCICIVFVPVVFITGAAKSLFVPLAMAVVFAMLTSYLLSRTLVPTMVHYLLASEVELYGGRSEPGERHAAARRDLIWRFHEAFNRLFDRLRHFYGKLPGAGRSRIAAAVLFVAVAFVIVSGALAPMIGRDFFPDGRCRANPAARAGPRRHADRGDRARSSPPWKTRSGADPLGQNRNADRQHRHPQQRHQSLAQRRLADVGGRRRNPHLARPKSSADGRLRAPTPPRRSTSSSRTSRSSSSRPTSSTQVLNFGLAAPIDIQLVGPRKNAEKNFKIAQTIRDRLAEIPGVVDAHLQQVPDTPDLRVDVDRTLVEPARPLQQDVASDLLVSLSSSGQAAPNFWLDPKSGVQYPLAVQTPQYMIDRSTRSTAHPSLRPAAKQPAASGQRGRRASSAGSDERHPLQYRPDASTCCRSARHRPGQRVERHRQAASTKSRPTLPRGTTVDVRGQVQSMNTLVSQA